MEHAIVWNGSEKALDRAWATRGVRGRAGDAPGVTACVLADSAPVAQGEGHDVAGAGEGGALGEESVTVVGRLLRRAHVSSRQLAPRADRGHRFAGMGCCRGAQRQQRSHHCERLSARCMASHLPKAADRKQAS